MSEDVVFDDAADPVVAVAVVAVVEDRSIVAVVDEASCRLYLSEDAVMSIIVDEASAACYHVDEDRWRCSRR